MCVPTRDTHIYINHLHPICLQPFSFDPYEYEHYSESVDHEQASLFDDALRDKNEYLEVAKYFVESDDAENPQQLHLHLNKMRFYQLHHLLSRELF